MCERKWYYNAVEKPIHFSLYGFPLRVVTIAYMYAIG